MGVISALIVFLCKQAFENGWFGLDHEIVLQNAEWTDSPWSHLLSLIAYGLLIFYFVKATRKQQK